MPVKKQAEPEEEPGGAPEWMVTFSDCMTLLLTFFVLLLSFSSFDDKVFWRLKIIYCKALTNISPNPQSDRDSFTHLAPIKYLEELDRGSEKPTLQRDEKDGLLEETEPEDFQYRKVFIVSSKKVFWGKGAAISSEGRDIMSTMASFLKEVPDRIVISENGPVEEDSVQFGLVRAWAVLEYLTEKQGLEKKRFSISAASTIPKERFNSGQVVAALERTIEIVLLERSIYN
jgi:chemotaxis protein MotB